MEHDETTAFVNGYTRILTAAWSSEEFSRRLDTDPAAVLAENGLEVPSGARVDVIRARDGGPDLSAQIQLWGTGRRSGHYVLYVPALPQLDDLDLMDEELGSLAGGDGGSYCCNPCCCQS